MSIVVKSIVSEDDGERDNYNIGNQTEEVEQIQLVLHSRFCSAANDVHPLNKEEVDDDLMSIGISFGG
jgi:hypothetical protein